MLLIEFCLHARLYVIMTNFCNLCCVLFVSIKTVQQRLELPCFPTQWVPLGNHILIILIDFHMRHLTIYVELDCVLVVLYSIIKYDIF